MKCGITDMSAGGSDMVGSLRTGFAYRGVIGIKTESPESFGQDAALRWSGVLQSEMWESGHLPCSPTTYMRQL